MKNIMVKEILFESEYQKIVKVTITSKDAIVEYVDSYRKEYHREFENGERWVEC